ncbi:MAG: hypothetical protein ACRENA_17135 [Vulcanimicrobiaceae bacterium]
MRKHLYRFVAALGLAGLALLPMTASAQGLSVQLYWGNNGQPYYYDQYRHRHYMSRDEQVVWIRQHDPDWYRQHRAEYRRDPQRFDRDWRAYAQERGYYHHDRDRDDQNHRY